MSSYSCRFCSTGIFGFIGILIIIIGGIWQAVQDNVLASFISKKMTINPDNEIYPNWKEVPIPLSLQIHFYNWTDAEEFQDPEYQKDRVPQLEIVGPYIYKEFIKKKNVTFAKEGDTVSFVVEKTYVFDRKNSIGDDSDHIILPNLPLFAGLSILDPVKNATMYGGLGMLVKMQKVKLHMKCSVREILFTGYSDYLTQAVGKKEPDLMPGGKFGIFLGKNATGDAKFEVYRGNADPSKVNSIYSFNGKTALADWWSSPCGMINGTDGSMMSSGIRKDKIYYLFDDAACRSVGVLFEKEETVMGIETYKFAGPDNSFAYGNDNPDNWCFCRGQTKDDSSTCPRKGLMDMGGCRGGVKILASMAHCYQCDPSIIAETNGIMQPNKSLHETYVSFDPITGMPMQAHKRAQINIQLEPQPRISRMANLSNLIFPVLWLDEGVTLTEEMAEFFKSHVLGPLKFAKCISSICYCVGAAFIFIAVLIFMACRNDRKVLSF